jgi:hypothetical protein
MANKPPKELRFLSQPELLDMCFILTGKSLHPGTEKQQIIDFMGYKEVELEPNPVNEMRAELVAFLKEYSEQVILPCNKNCYQHSDATVVACYSEYLGDNRIDISEDDLLAGGDTGGATSG